MTEVQSSAKMLRRMMAAALVVLACGLLPAKLAAQNGSQNGSQAEARALIAAAARTELDADRNDHSAYVYRDHDIIEGKQDTIVMVVETPQGNLRKTLEDHGRKLTPEQRAADDQKMLTLVNDTSLQRKQRNADSHDDNQSEQLLKLLPTAFIWTVVGEQGDLVTLDFKPDPSFQPANMEAQVFACMAGQVVVARGDNRIRTMKGQMIRDVKIAWGMLGGLHKGGTFEVQRREVSPHHWQFTELHVHIEGKVFFATIGSQEDEVRTEFRPSPAQTLQQAYDLLKNVQ